jgi:hypothetical protein
MTNPFAAHVAFGLERAFLEGMANYLQVPPVRPDIPHTYTYIVEPPMPDQIASWSNLKLDVEALLKPHCLGDNDHDPAPCGKCLGMRDEIMHLFLEYLVLK